MKLCKILLVEDEMIISLHFRRMLERLGNYDIRCESYGEKAIEHAVEFKPDVIFMDVTLKGEMNGIEAAEHIIHENKIPIIFTTAYSDNETIAQVKSLNPFGYLTKPVNFEAIKELINELEKRNSFIHNYEGTTHEGSYGDFYEPPIMLTPHFAFRKDK